MAQELGKERGREGTGKKGDKKDIEKEEDKEQHNYGQRNRKKRPFLNPSG